MNHLNSPSLKATWAVFHKVDRNTFLMGKVVEK